jgi:heat shock protein HslJ
MKKLLKFTAVLLIVAGAFACTEKENNSDVTTGLKGTKWKLEGFVNVATGNLKVPEPNEPESYILTFDTDSTFSGTTSTNEVSGIYSIDYEKSILNITQCGGTEINELFDGKLFVQSFLSVQSFSLSGSELKLYYSEGKNYLLYSNEDLYSRTFVQNGIVEYCPPPDNCNDFMIDFSPDSEYRKFYKPDKLPEEFKIDKLKVKVTYRLNREKYNCGFGGDVPVINVLKIDKL